MESTRHGLQAASDTADRHARPRTNGLTRLLVCQCRSSRTGGGLSARLESPGVALLHAHVVARMNRAFLMLQKSCTFLIRSTLYFGCKTWSPPRRLGGGSFSPDQVKGLCMWFQTSCTPSHNGIRAPGLALQEGAVAPAWTGHSRRRQQRSMYVHNLALHSCTHNRSRSIRVSTSTAAARHSRSSNRRLRSTCTLFCTISSRQQEPFAERPRLIRWPTSCATTAHMKKHPPSDVHRWRVHVELWKALSDTL